MDETCRALGRMESRECILMAYVREALTAFIYSTGRGKTGKTDAPIENELDIVRN